MVTSRIRVYGPLWDGEADAAIKAWLDDTTAKLAHQGEEIIKSKARRFNRSHRGGTGRAADHVRAHKVSESWFITGDNNRGVVWWPWLEGTSRRNQTTRFKGYHVFRLTRAILRKRMKNVAQDELDAWIGRMGGHVG